MLHRARTIGPQTLGPLIAAVFTGVELARYGAFTAAVAAYLVLAATQAAVVSWNRHQLRQARRRLTALRSRRR